MISFKFIQFTQTNICFIAIEPGRKFNLILYISDRNLQAELENLRDVICIDNI